MGVQSKPNSPNGLEAIYMGVFISPNLKKTSERIDTSGNVIDPKTKQILKTNESEYVPPVEVVANPVIETTQTDKVEIVSTNPNLSITEQIEAAKQLVLDLEQKKKEIIEAKRKELEELENV